MAEEEIQNDVKEVKEEIVDIAPFDPTTKKKKKKGMIQNHAEEESVDNLAEKTAGLSVSDKLVSKRRNQLVIAPSVHTDILDDDKEIAGNELDDIGDDEGEGVVPQEYPWNGSDRDHEHDELLDRVFNILRENNSALAGDRRRTVMRTPQVCKFPKITVFVNFMDLCKMMHRQPEHVMTFLLAELGTSGSLDGQQRLLVMGRFDSNEF